MHSLPYIIQAWAGIKRFFLNSPTSTAQRIYYANHTSNFDAPVIWASLPAGQRPHTRPVAGRDYWSRGLRRRFANLFRPVFVDRKGERTTRHPLEPVWDALDQGDSLIIFPEGGRSRDLEVQEFKSGLYRLAKSRPEIELVPVYLHNVHRIMPPGDPIPTPGYSSRVCFGEPLKLNKKEKKQAFLDRARDALLDCAQAA